MKACSLVPERFADGRHEAIRAGLRRAGLTACDAPQAADLLVTWNLHRAAVRQAAAACEARGGRVIVCEEGYTRRLVERPQIAMALGGHNGSGVWYPAGPERLRRLGLRLAPWQRGGESILVCASRGMGSAAMREPPGWLADVCGRLRRLTERPLRVRGHPGKAYAERPLQRDLAGCWAVVVWASNSATEALARGLPVFYEAPQIITAGAAERGLARIERPSYPDRQPVFERLAWAQWSLEEVAAGDPFRHLLLRRPAGETGDAGHR